MEVRVLGPVELVDGSTAVRLAPAERILLAALASRVGERVGIDVLVEALWPERPPATARKTLQGHIARLRRSLGVRAIVERSGGYLLDPDTIEIDAQRIAQRLGDARQAIAGGHAGDVIDVLRESQRAFRGEPYADVPDAALPAGEAQRLHELNAALIEETVEAELAQGTGQRSIGELEALVQRHPYRERAWGQLMLALYQAGRPADALDAYGRVRMLLAAELGLEPGPAFRELERSILAHDPYLVRTDSVRTGLGRSNLPVGLSPIVGRQRELAALDPLLQDNRLLTITGTGGIGKTTLAVEVAARTAGRYEFGPYFVDLAPLGDVELIPATLVAALGVEVDRNADVMGRVRSALAEHTVVVITDNCEHLLPGVAELVAGLLASTPGVRVVATSREPLGVAGERVWPLDPLAVPPADGSAEEVLASESGAMFITRLPINVTTRSLSAEDVAAVGVICRGLEGMPLALELAAARSRTLSLSDLADRLGDSISDLTLPGHGVLPRHRTLRAALDWGYRLLSPVAQHGLRAMSVFAGGCDLAAFTAVCVDDDDGLSALDVVDELVRTSFVVADVTGQQARYRLLEPIRQYASQLLDASGERDDRRRRHLEHYSGFARTLQAGEDESGIVHFDELNQELGNLRVALDWATGSSEDAEIGLYLAADMYHVWTAGAHHAEGAARLDQLLDSGYGSADARSVAAFTAAVVAGQMGQGERSLALAERTLDEAGRGASNAHERRARLLLAQCLNNMGDVAAARRCLEPALPTGAEQTTDVDAMCLVAQATLDLVAGALDDAEAAAQRVLGGRFGSFPWIGPSARYILSEVMLERGDLDAARYSLSESLTLSESIGDLVAAVDAHLDLVFIECAAGRIDEAEAHLRAAAVLAPNTHRGGFQDLVFLEAGTALALCGDSPGQAVGLAEAGFAVAGESHGAIDRCLCLRLLGDAQLATGDFAGALATFEQLIALADDILAPCRAADGHEGAAAANIAVGRVDDAHRHLDEAAEIRRRTGSQPLRRPVVQEYLTDVAR